MGEQEVEQVVGGKRGHRRPLRARMFRSSELELPLSPLQRSAKNEVLHSRVVVRTVRGCG